MRQRMLRRSTSTSRSAAAAAAFTPTTAHIAPDLATHTVLLVQPVRRRHPGRDLLAVPLTEIVGGAGGRFGVREGDGARVLLQI